MKIYDPVKTLFPLSLVLTLIIAYWGHAGNLFPPELTILNDFTAVNASDLSKSARPYDTGRIGPNIIVGEAQLLSQQNSRLHHVESHMVVSPLNPDHWLVAAMIVDDPVAWEFHVAVWRTTDAGKTWTRTDFPKVMADPNLSMDIKGNVYLSGLGQSLKGDRNEYYYISNDGGKSWSNGYSVSGGHDHPFLISEGTNTYWWSTTRGNRILNIRKAVDGGTFENIRTIKFDDSFRHDNMMPAVLNDGTLILPHSAYISGRSSIDPKGSYLFKTKNGVDVSGPIELTKRQGTSKGTASMLADNTESVYRGNLYYLYTLGVFRVSKGIGMSISEDGGETWKDITVQKPSPRGEKYYIPTGAINKDGVIGIYWNQHGRNRSIIDNDIYFTASKDGGKTFLDPVKVTRVTSRLARQGPSSRVAGTFPGGGHYSGMDVLPDGSFQLVWSDARSGIYQLYTANVVVE